jgi:predicted esterase
MMRIGCICLLILAGMLGNTYAQEKDEKLLTFKEIDEAAEYYRLGQDQYSAGKFSEAAENFAKCFNMIGSNRKAAYNAACCYAQANNKAKAIEYAYKALQQGIFGFAEDKDFANIKDSPEFRELVGMATLMKEETLKQSIKPIVIFPPGYDKSKKYPMIVALHGFGSGPIEFSSYYKEAAEKNNCVLFLCRGTKILGKESFAWNLDQEEYERVFDEISMAIIQYNIDKEKVILSGYSQGGGFMAYAFGMVYSQIFCGIIPVAGSMPTNLSVSKMKNKDLKIYAVVGLRDNQNTVAQNEKAKKIFTDNNVDFKLNKLDIGHAYPANSTELLTEAFKWFIN